MTLPLDTSPDARARQNDVYRRIGGAERVAILFRLSALVRDTARAGIRRRHPSYGAGEIDLALRRLVLGDELTRKAFPNDELVDP